MIRKGVSMSGAPFHFISPFRTKFKKPDWISMVCPKPHKRGFSLVELIVTMVLIGILAAVAIPRMFDATAFRSRGFYDEVINAARYGQKLAVASGCVVKLSITSGTGTDGGYALYQRADSCTTGDFKQTVPKPAGSGSFAANAPSGVFLSATTSSIIFDSQGRAKPGGVKITVDGRSFTIAGESGYVGGL
jgi:MSHA pilin protein MshC